MSKPVLVGVTLMTAFVLFAGCWQVVRPWWENENGPIAFYGRVVDQHDTPVPGVVVTAELSRNRQPMIPIPWHGQAKYENLTAMTDAQGRFEFKAYGRHLFITSIEKVGYESSRKNLGNIDAFRPEAEWDKPVHPDRSRPYTFRLERKP